MYKSGDWKFEFLSNRIVNEPWNSLIPDAWVEKNVYLASGAQKVLLSQVPNRHGSEGDDILLISDVCPLVNFGKSIGDLFPKIGDPFDDGWPPTTTVDHPYEPFLYIPYARNIKLG